jgi:predicted DNA-binding protein
MGRPNTKGKTPQHVGSSVTQEFFDRFDAFCKERGMVKAFVVQKAVEEYMDRVALVKKAAK